MKRLVPFVSLVCLFTLCLAPAALAVSSPTITTILPSSAPNTQDTPVVITGTGFAPGATVTLGTTPLTPVTFVSDTQLTATVPSGLTPGSYDLTVTNSDSGTVTHSGAFTVTPPPMVSAIQPTSAYNDIDMPVTITGSDFVSTPTITLGSTALTDVAFVDATTLTATVPWGMDPGTYDLTVTNPDGGVGSLSAAYTVGAGIGQWNAGHLYGGDVHQLLFKPGDPSTLYAPAYGISGLFRSTDAGASWQYVGGSLFLGNFKLAVDPQHPSWLWAYDHNGVACSKDEGDTWTTVLSAWPDGRPIAHGQVYPSPYDPEVLFVSSYIDPIESSSPGAAQGLIRSVDGGATWKIVKSLDGASVMDVAFDPNDPSQMVALAQDAQVYDSTDAGRTWSAVASPATGSIGIFSIIAYNPYVPGQVWIVCYKLPFSGTVTGLFKSTDAALSGWQDVLSGYSGGGHITFTGADSVYVPWLHSTDGGTDWQAFGPVTGQGDLVFDPTDPLVGYVGDTTYGVQKTTDGGQSWQVADQGLAGMTCSAMDVSPSDPLRVYAIFGNWPGVYSSGDGASTWGYAQVPGSYPLLDGVRVDPTDSDRVYAQEHDKVYRSTDGGASWDDLGWNVSGSLPQGGLWGLTPDPFQAGHLLVAYDTGDNLTSYLYESTDYGASWQAVATPPGLGRVSDIAFDPQTAGLVYLAAGGFGAMPGSGVYRSTDDGADWTSVDDPSLPDMQYATSIAIATHPQQMVTVEANAYVYRSTDEGATWQKSENPEYPGPEMFADGDSTRLYRGTTEGLFFSGDAGDTWKRAAGAFGHLQVMAVDSADQDGHTIIYAATNGGQAGATGGTRAGTRRADLGTTSTMVEAGVYRCVVVKPTLTLKVSGLRSGSIKLGKSVTAKGIVTPISLAGSKVTLTAQLKKGTKWVKAKIASALITSTGAYSWKYKPAKKGTYRMQSTIANTATNAAATTKWLAFKVK